MLFAVVANLLPLMTLRVLARADVEPVVELPQTFAGGDEQPHQAQDPAARRQQARGVRA